MIIILCKDNKNNNGRSPNFSLSQSSLDDYFREAVACASCSSMRSYRLGPAGVLR